MVLEVSVGIGMSLALPHKEKLQPLVLVLVRPNLSWVFFLKALLGRPYIFPSAIFLVLPCLDASGWGQVLGWFGPAPFLPGLMGLTSYGVVKFPFNAKKRDHDGGHHLLLNNYPQLVNSNTW